MKTYTTLRSNPVSFLREAFQLYRIKSSNIPAQVQGTIAYMQICEERIARVTGATIVDKKTLIIGPGQTPREIAYLGLRNEVVGIDLDVIPQNPGIAGYMKMLKQNGPMRTLKTLARKSLGLDTKYANELRNQLGVDHLPRTTMQQMDAAKMTFEKESFDFVYSFSVFEHLPDPAGVLDETLRVLRPGGVAYISLHLYASEGGAHDIRIFSGNRASVPYWAHLRPEHEEKVQPNAYLNKLRVSEWEALFQQKMPGVHFEYEGFDPVSKKELLEQLAQLRKAGELKDFSDEELMQVNIIAVWKKPES